MEETGTVITVTNMITDYYTALSRKITLSPKAAVSHNKPGASIGFPVASVTMHFGIGTDHVAYLSMTEEAWRALKEGQALDITTINELKKKL